MNFRKIARGHFPVHLSVLQDGAVEMGYLGIAPPLDGCMIRPAVSTLRHCSIMMGPFRWATVSSVKRAFAPFWKGHLCGTTEPSYHNQTGP